VSVCNVSSAFLWIEETGETDEMTYSPSSTAPSPNASIVTVDVEAVTERSSKVTTLVFTTVYLYSNPLVSFPN
jgi:hypothetical protein